VILTEDYWSPTSSTYASYVVVKADLVSGR